VKLFAADRVAMTTREAVGSGLVLIVAVLLGAFAWHQRNVRGDSEQENLSFLHALHADAVAGVSISDEHGASLKTVTDAAGLASFASAVNSLEPYQPNHPYATSKFQVALRPKDGPMRRFEVYTMFPADQTIYIDLHPAGNGKSKQLFEWMKAQGFIQ
jgi:hypothetical protein